MCVCATVNIKSKRNRYESDRETKNENVDETP